MAFPDELVELMNRSVALMQDRTLPMAGRPGMDGDPSHIKSRTRIFSRIPRGCVSFRCNDALYIYV